MDVAAADVLRPGLPMQTVREGRADGVHPAAHTIACFDDQERRVPVIVECERCAQAGKARANDGDINRSEGLGLSRDVRPTGPARRRSPYRSRYQHRRSWRF